MEMHQVRYFLAVCRTLNFTKAAEECNVAQPSLTRAIQKLEEEFGGLLFHRERANTHLTELGRAMQPHLERTFEAAQSAKTLAAGFKRGDRVHLRLGVSTTVPTNAIALLLKGVRAAVPNFEITLSSACDTALVNEALTGDLDLIFAGDDTELPEKIRSWTLYREKLLALLPPKHELAAKTSLSPEDLNGLEIIELTGDGIGGRLRRVCEDRGLAPDLRLRVANPLQAVSLVDQGIGAAILPACLATSQHAKPKPIDGLDLERAITLCAVAGRKFSPASDAFVKLARTRDWANELIGASASV